MIYVVVGLGFGDEGKGFTTDYLCLQHPNSIVVRFNGGHQAGHTVTVGKKRHIFSNFGSGTLRGVPTYWSKNCTVDPVGIMREYEDLKEYNPQLYLDMDSPVVTPYDKFFNQLHARTIHDGTCGVGFGTTVQREEDLYSLKTIDLMFNEVFLFKLDAIRKYYSDKYNYPIGKQLDYDLKIFMQSVEFIRDCDNISIVDSIPEANDYILEGAQGVLLDKNVGFFPHVTRSNTTLQAAKEFVERTPELKNQYISTYFVTRAYQTRHGNGPMTNKKLKLKIKKDVIETNVTNKFQGEFKRTVLDVDLLLYSLYKQGVTMINESINLMITCLDHLEEYQYTANEKLCILLTKDAFLENLVSELPIRSSNVYVSESVSAENVWKFQK